VQKDESYEALLSRVERLEKMIESGVVQRAQQPVKAQAPINEPEEEEFFPIRDDDFAQHDAYSALDDLAPPPENYDDGGFVMPEPAINSTPPIKRETVSAPKKAEPTVEKPQQNQTPVEVISGDGDVDEGRSIWNGAINEARNQKIMRLFVAMKKAKVTAFDGTTLSVTFSPDDEASAKRLDNPELKDKLKNTLKKISSRDIIVEIKLKQLNEEENSFMQSVYDKFPKDLVSHEYDD
jgi:hypothetical protein